jgi:hypothetical protein
VPNLDESIEELRQIADGRDDVLAQAAGITAGSWYAGPATHVGYERGMRSRRASGEEPLAKRSSKTRRTALGYLSLCLTLVRTSNR